MTPARDTAAHPQPVEAQPETTPLLQMQGIVKRFGKNTALTGVDFDLRTGEIHALLGENGAGKSTLMHVLSGLYRPDEGTIRLQNLPLSLPSPQAARKAGIAMVHQHFALVPAFTVAENLALDAPTRPRLGYSVLEAAQPALQRAAALGWKLDPQARVHTLSVGEQQRIEIVKALATDAPLLIFDEPTAVLSPNEVAELFAVLRRLRDEGKAIVLIAHKLAEIIAIADRVTVLRRGNKVATAAISNTNSEQLARWMIGETPPNTHAEHHGTTTNPDNNPALKAHALSVRGDRGETVLASLSLCVHKGEIYGIGGVDGNGQSELAEALTGLRPLAAGEITWNNAPFNPQTAPTTGYIPQDRRRMGLATTMSVEENLLFSAVQDPRYRKGPFLRPKALHNLATNLIAQFDVRTTSASIPAASLSGGNQQKIVVARTLHNVPEWIVAMNPTRGLDIGATQFVHDQLLQAKARGAAILLLSADLDELHALADRTAILAHGRLTEYDSKTTTPEQIGLLMGGVSETKEANHA